MKICFLSVKSCAKGAVNLRKYVSQKQKGKRITGYQFQSREKTAWLLKTSYRGKPPINGFSCIGKITHLSPYLIGKQRALNLEGLATCNFRLYLKIGRTSV